MRPRTFFSYSLVGLFLASPILATSIRLRSKVTVERPIVTLGDIAEEPSDAGEETRRLLDIELMPAPEPGETKWLDLTALRDQLARKGISMAELELIGSSRIEISAAESMMDGSDSARSKNWENIIERMLRRNIEASSDWSGRETEIKIDGPRTFEFLTTCYPKCFELVLPKRWNLGQQVVWLEAPIGGSLSRYPLRVDLAEVRSVVVTTRRIHRGVKLSPSDIELVSHVVRTKDLLWIEDLSKTFEKELKRTIEKGKPISPSDLKSPPMVFRGSQVTVHVRFGTASLDIFAVAKEDGGLGDWIEVVNPTSRKALKFKVRVIGFQTAEMPGASASSNLN